ncbi:MAG: chemotaxis protein CheB, partial [Lachnospiraceae bacterium]|nr:chemotaxis protein CheB [Lachnospiraceae bacterium]
MEYSPAGLSREIPPNCVVGIGASAGGLEALQQFLTFLPSNTGMAFVIIQHLAPDHKSLLSDILGKYTVMPVREAKDGMRVERNSIYMIPPKYNLEIDSDTLKLSEYNHAKINHPIDIFFRSLASAYENRAVAVILSGTGSDGTNGIRSIKERNGMIIVQSPESAKFDGMPRNAIATGFVDLVLNPDSIARELSHIANSLAVTSSRQLLTDEDLMSQIFTILKDVTNINYAYYKQTTILRRIERRLVLTHSRNLREYVNYLSNNPEEARLLAKEVLIGVTSFFRDADYFEVLKERVITNLVKNARQGDQIRVWVAGCSTGEEAYSIAILFSEVMEELGMRRDVKIFATDLDSDAIMQANRGIYGDNIIEDVSLNRLSRYFTRKGNKYVIRHDIRKMIIFAQHNVFQDPPFGKLDLISCRNLLIYFQTTLQRSLFAIFHMALNDGGTLFLGRSESVIDYDDVFRVQCANEKIFTHYAAGRAPVHERLNYAMRLADNIIDPIIIPDTRPYQDVSYKTGELDTKVLETLLPPCILVNEKNELVHSYGDCTDYISIPSGGVTLDIFSLIRNDLKIALSTALREARSSNDRVIYNDVPVVFDEKPELIKVVAQPILDKIGEDTGFIA